MWMFEFPWGGHWGGGGGRVGQKNRTDIGRMLVEQFTKVP